ncbi:MAG: hypothetical protein ACOX3R_06710 [Desulfitobacteriia bacterium]
MKSETENKQDNRQAMTRVKEPKKVAPEINTEITPGISSKINPKGEQAEKKKNQTSTIFLWTVYALSILLIILIICDNLQS